MKSNIYKTLIIIFLSTTLTSKISAEDTIKIGVLACLSGGCAEWGNATKNGLQLALDKINSNEGVLNKKIELLFEDTNEATAAMQAVTAFRLLNSRHKIKFFIGPSWTPAGLALAPIAGKMDDVVMISPSLGVAEFNEYAPNLFNTMMHSETATQKLANLAFEQGWRNAGVFSSQQPWENLQGKVFSEEFSRLGGKISLLIEPLPDVVDLRTECLKMISSKPDVIFLANLNQEGIAAKRLRALNYKGPFFSALIDQTRINEANGALEGAISAQSPESEPEFVDQYIAKYGFKPTSSADTAHDALIALSKAIALTNSTDPIRVRENLQKVQFDGASGKVLFDHKGGVIREPFIVKVENNQLVPVED
ncbi:MAG TPA: ABC transporter substrate-binding protein [Oligoflexia bacterium]|nr:ABC transporter substrate-binding protein [Oligoflexia bacterium]HMP47375.1 ABC transporter substrate-binding protein [Oligoflexia bacterium]